MNHHAWLHYAAKGNKGLPKAAQAPESIAYSSLKATDKHQDIS